MKRGLVGRVERLELEASAVLEEAQRACTPEELADLLLAKRAEYLELGYLVDTPWGLKISDGLSRMSHEHGVAILLTAFPELLRHRGIECDGQRELGGGDAWASRG